MTASNARPLPQVDVIRIPSDANGRDPLVGEYLEMFRAECAFYTISWLWVALGVVGALAGAVLGDHLVGSAPAIASHNQLIVWLNGVFGNPLGVLVGMLAGGGIVSALGVAINRHHVPTGQEPLAATAVLMLSYLLVYDPLVFVSVVTGVLCTAYLLAIGFRLLALMLGGHRGMRADETPDPDGGWPIYTILVPLYREENIAGSILASLERLDYPRDRLDVKFLLEADDPRTLAALEEAGIPDFAEVIVVPDAHPKTKPRACMHGLSRARGEFIVIYDAEDRPEPDQLKQAVHCFAAASPMVVCLQAHLAYHNHDQNLLTRWFALEYNVWFGRYLPGLERLGVPIPLGGTSNHFRARELQDLGGWDPFNVTEDCDLGVRLHIAGFQTAVLDSVTWEEAASSLGNWIRQRSRWLKGYLITHLVWWRRPIRLLVELGVWPTLGFLLSVFCVAALSAANLVLWLVFGLYLALLGADACKGYRFWELLTTRDFEHNRLSWPMIYQGAGEDPFWAALSQIFFAASACLLLGNLAFVLIGVFAGRRKDQAGLLFAALTTPLYWFWISVAAWKGIWQLLSKPHYWEKTVHGQDAPGAGAAKETVEA